MEILLAAVSQGVLFLPLALGIYLSYAIFRTTDMTVDGSFVLGAAIFAKVLTLTQRPFLSLVSAIIGGSLAGLGVSLIQSKEKVSPLLAGILMLFILYSVNFQIMGQPNISLLNLPTLGGLSTESNNNLLLACMGATLVMVLLGLLLKSRLGLMLRAFGDNKQLLGRLGNPIEVYRILGLALSNACVALCGALTAQVNGYADLGMGFGMTLIGIGTVVIGRQLCKPFYHHHRFNLGLELLACTLGVMLYFMAINYFLAIDIDPINLKLLLGLLLIIGLRCTRDPLYRFRSE